MNVSHPTDQKILKAIKARRKPAALSPNHFRSLGTPDAVWQALSRLVKDGKLRRIRRGLYDLPRSHPIIGQTAPDIMATVKALMRGSQARWLMSGAYAANLLGLSDQVPAKIVIFTDGAPRKVTLGKLVLAFRRASPRNLVGAGRPAGTVIQALRFMKGSPDTPRHVVRLRRLLDRKTKADLRLLASRLPAWMQPLIAEIAAE